MKYNRILRSAYDKAYCTLVTLMILMMPNCSLKRVEVELQNYYNTLMWTYLFCWKDKSPENILRIVAIGLPVRIRRIIINRYTLHLWTSWEKEVVSSAPTVTVSDKIAEELKVSGNTNRVFVVPNFPMKSETDNIEKPYMHPKLSSVYAGSDGLNKQKVPSRNIDGIIDTFINGDIGELTIIGWEGSCSSKKITYKGRLSRRAMFDEMSKHSIGLLPWKKHWSHGFVSPNKAYEYAHAGLFVGCTSTFETVLRTLKDNCISFEDYSDLVSQLEYFRDNLDEYYKKRLKIFEFARNDLIWEKYEKNIRSVCPPRIMRTSPNSFSSFKREVEQQ